MRQSSTESATLYKEGTKKKGNDGNIWIVSLTKTNIKRWKKFKIISPSTYNKVNSNKVNSNKVNSNKIKLSKVKSNTVNSNTVNSDKVKLLLTEPYTFHGLSKNRDVTITVNYNLVKKLPKLYKNYMHNGYLFGKKFPLSEYKYIGEHFNDGAQTGLINLNLLKNVTQQNLKKMNDDILDMLYKIRKITKSDYWFQKDLNKNIKKMYPYIIFIGDTYGGDIGAALYAHYNGKEVDSLIIDSYYFYPYNEKLNK